MEIWGNKAYHKSALTPFFCSSCTCVVCARACTLDCALYFHGRLSLLSLRTRARRTTPRRARFLVPAHQCCFPLTQHWLALIVLLLLSKRSEGRICAFTAMLRTTANVQCSHTFEVQLNQKLKFWFKVHKIVLIVKTEQFQVCNK